MKKFLLLIVGVLFALSANAEDMTWTIYADVSAKNWKEVWLRYGDYKNSANVAKGWVVDPVKNIYKFQFKADKGLSSIAFTNWGNDWGNPSSGWGENIVGDFKPNNTNANYVLANGKLYTFKPGKENGAPATDYIEQPAVYLVGKFGGVEHWTPGTNAYKFEGTWDNLTLDLSTVKGEDDSTLSSITTEDEFAIVCLNDNKWHKNKGNEGDEVQNLLNKGEAYQTWDSTKKNIKVSETINNPVISLNSYNWQITITENAGTPDPDPTDYTIYFDAARSSWSKVELTGAEATASVAENGLNKFEFSTSGNVYFSDGDATQIIVNPLTNDHVYYVERNELKDGGEYASYKTLAQWEIRLSGEFNGWKNPGANDTNAPLFTYQGGAKFILYLNSTLESGKGFKVYDVTNVTNWGTGWGTNGEQISLGTAYKLTQTNDKNKNITPNDNIVRPLLTLDVSTWTLTITEPKLDFTYAIHGNIITGNTDDYTMNRMGDSNYWGFEGYLKDGWFGIKKLQNGNQYEEGGHDEWGWIYSQENATIDLGTWNKAVVKGVPEQGAGNWTISSGLKGEVLYTIMFDAKNMQILVSTVAPSGVEDINVDEDAPVEYFNLQGQRVNGELTPGIYIRRQGSTVTKVRF